MPPTVQPQVWADPRYETTPRVTPGNIWAPVQPEAPQAPMPQPQGIDLHAGLAPVFAPTPPPTVTLDPNKAHQREGATENLMARYPNPQDMITAHNQEQLAKDYAKDAERPTSVWGKIGHTLNVPFGGKARQLDENALMGNINTATGDESQNALRGAQTSAEQARVPLEEAQTKAAQLIQITPEMAMDMGQPGLAGESVTQGALQHILTTHQTVQQRELTAKPIVGADGTEYRMDPAHPGMAVPIMGPGGQPIKGVQKPVDVIKQLQNEIAAAQGMGDHATVQRLQAQMEAAQPIQYMTAQAGMGRAGAMEENAGINQNRFSADYYGMGPNGQPIPGAPMINGEPVGFKGGLGATLTNRLAVANAVNEMKPQLDASIDAAARIGVIGPAGGRFTSFQQLVGDPSPEAQYLWAQIKSFTTLMPALHAMRSAELAQYLDTASGGLKQTPESLKGYFAGLASVTNPISSGINETRYTKPSASSTAPQHNTGGWTPPEGAPAAPAQDNKYLYDSNHKPVAKSQGGKWVQP